MLRDDRCPDHRAVIRDDSGVVGDQQPATARGHVRHAIDLDPPVMPVEPQRDVLDAICELGIEAEAIAASEFQP